MQPDTATAYGTVSRILHWLMAAGFAYMLFTVTAWSYDEEYFSLIDNHKSVGFVLLVLIVVRLLWAAVNFSRRPHGNILVKIGHLALYALMLAVPVVAMIRQYGSARGTLEVFGVPLVSGAAEKIDWMVQLGGQWHGNLGWILFALAGGHIVMAVAHQLKGEKIINRMAGPRR